MNAASGIFLLGDLVYHAVLGIVGHFLSHPFSLRHLFQVVAPGLLLIVVLSSTQCEA